MTHELWLWIGFNAFIVGMLVLDLAVFHKKPHEVTFREAAGWSVFWIGLALAFNAGLWYLRGGQAGLEFLTGYLIEKSLSVDNLFVFLLVFSYFAVPAKNQHSVLFWGILGALVFRFVFIIAGVELLERFHWLIYVFGAVLIVSGVKLWQEREKKIEPEKNPVVRLFRRLIPVTPRSRRPIPRAAGREARGYAAVSGAARGRDHRYRVRGRLDPRDPRDHARPIHRLQLERVRDPRAARALLRALGCHGDVSPPALRAGGDPRVHRRQDDRLGVHQGADRDLARDRGDDPRDLDLGEPPVAREGRACSAGGSGRLGQYGRAVQGAPFPDCARRQLRYTQPLAGRHSQVAKATVCKVFLADFHK